MFFIDLYMRKELSEIMRRLPAGWMRVVVDWDFCVSSSGISLGWIASGEKYLVARLVSLGY